MHPKRSSCSFLSLAAFTALVSCLPAASAADSSVVQSDLVRTGLDVDAKGKLQAQLGAKSSHLLLQLSGLEPNTVYLIEIGGVVEGSVTTNRRGAGSVRFRSPTSGRDQALDFDPRGQVLRVLLGAESVLQATLGAAGEPAGAVVIERVSLPLGANVTATGKASAEYRLEKSGRRRFKVELQGAGAGPFALYVGGVERGAFTVRGRLAQIKFDTVDAKVLPLDFDPRGQVVDVVSGGEVLFSSELAAQIPQVNVASPTFSVSEIASTGEDPDGTAKARLLVDDRARKHFSVEVEDVPEGSYDLLVEGAKVGEIAVGPAQNKAVKAKSNSGGEEGGTEGEIVFSSGAGDDADEAELTFDPTGKTLTVSAGETVYFSSVFTPSVKGSGKGVPSSKETASELEEVLNTTGVDADATGKARYRVDERGRHRFNVEIEDVVAGDYALFVAGERRGTITVAQSPEELAGELEFTSKKEAGKRPLNFDPRGQLIEISDAVGVYFSHFLGSAAQGEGLSASVVPFAHRLPLLATEAAGNAKAKAELKRKILGKTSFSVEVEGLPEGDYEVLVGGLVRATLTVVAAGNGTGAEVEFENEGEGEGQGAPLLDFEVLDQEIVIRQGDTVYFSRTFAP